MTKVGEVACWQASAERPIVPGTGTLTLENNTAGAVLEVSQVDGRAYVENNTASAPTGSY